MELTWIPLAMKAGVVVGVAEGVEDEVGLGVALGVRVGLAVDDALGVGEGDAHVHMLVLFVG